MRIMVEPSSALLRRETVVEAIRVHVHIARCGTSLRRRRTSETATESWRIRSIPSWVRAGDVHPRVEVPHDGDGSYAARNARAQVRSARGTVAELARPVVAPAVRRPGAREGAGMVAACGDVAEAQPAGD